MAKKETESIFPSEEELIKKYKPNLKMLIEHIDTLRKSEGMDWTEFEDKVRVSQKVVSSWGVEKKDGKPKEGKVSMPKLGRILMIAEYFNVSIDWLVGLSANREHSPVPITYKEWIIAIENYLGYGAVKPFYRPELGKSPDYDEDTQKAMESMKDAIEKRMSGGFRSDLPPTRGIPLEDDFRDYQPGYTYTPPSDSIYDVSEDMDGVYPDILEIKDTFLRCLVACLHYYKENESGECYEIFRESVIKQYGNKKLLNLDVYELRADTYLKETAQDRKLFQKYNTVSEIVFAKYKSIREINTKELGKIWKQLEFWKEKLDEGKIKTKSQKGQEYFEKKQD